MISQIGSIKIREIVKVIQQFANRIWYPYFIGFLAGLDNFIVIIPTDGIMISSTLLTPRRWLGLALCVAIGSTLGAIGLSALVEIHGLPWILEIYPGINESSTWQVASNFFDQYGLILVFICALTPLPQQPPVMIASLASTPFTHLAITIFLGRLIKYLIMAYIASHAPRLLVKMWGLKSEMKDVGLNLK